MRNIAFLRQTSVVLATLCTSSICFQASAAGAETPQLMAMTPPGTNPNLAQWSLINLLPADVASASGGAGVKVALLDGKTDCRDSDLTGRCTNILQSTGVYTAYATHGTHTAGIIAGKTYGVAPDATILDYGVFDDTGYIASIKLGSIWKNAYAAGARVASMSFGCTKMALCYGSNDLTAIASATAPMAYVKSAGNDGVALPNEFVPVASTTATAALNRIILVGSTDASGNISSFSNRPGEGCLLSMGTATCPEQMKWKYHFIVAPGENIYSTLPNGSYGYMTGTSMAAPVVSGVIALLEQRWPALKQTPEKVANILFATATDKGAVGVDAVYGYGLLNAAAAFKAYGTVSLVSPSGIATALTGKTITTTASMAKIGQALGSATVFDSFGRDFSAAETGAVNVRANVLAMAQALGQRMLGSLETDALSDSFFAEHHTARSFSMFGSPSGVPEGGLTFDRSARIGIDMPFEGGAAQFRLTGNGDTRLDFAYDPTMKPLANFASTGLLKSALISNALINLPGHSRLMLYGVVTTGAVDARLPYNPQEMLLTQQGYISRNTAALTKSHAEQKHDGIGIGYWTQPDRNSVIGVNFSAISQHGGYYTLITDLADLDKPTRMFNLGVASSRKMGEWELSISGEMTDIRMAGNTGAISFTTANLASGEISLRRKGVAFTNSSVRDVLGIAFVVPPRAFSGNLRVDYLTRTSDGFGLQAASYAVPISRLGFEPARLETAYRISAGSSWTFRLSGGVNLANAAAMGLGEAKASLTFSL